MTTESTSGSSGRVRQTTTTAAAGTQTRPGEGGPLAGQRDLSLQQGTGKAALVTDVGTTRISDAVVAKVAGLAARDIPGVFSMGGGTARRGGQLRSLIPRLGPGADSAIAGQGVTVTVAEREVTVDLDIVIWSGQSIVDISEAVRRHVIGQVEGVTGLKVTAVNIEIEDVHVEAQDQPAAPMSAGRPQGQ